MSVNYHFTRKCNKECGFCFHTAKVSRNNLIHVFQLTTLQTSFVLPLEEAKRGLLLLKKAGMKKINFAGGEPFLYPKFLGNLIVFCKDVLHLESVSIVSNGSKITEAFLRQYGRYIDILAVSCDSFDEETNITIGRGDGYNVEKLRKIADWCKQYGVMFKMNSVICRYNFDEDMAANIAEIGPFRWKCFQMLIQPGENDSADSLRDARKFIITDEEYEQFCEKHQHLECFVAEPNRLMAASYLILDEYMRFLDKEKDIQSESILEVGVAEALKKVHWDEKGFEERGGFYDWTKKPEENNEQVPVNHTNGGCGVNGGNSSSLQW